MTPASLHMDLKFKLKGLCRTTFTTRSREGVTDRQQSYPMSREFTCDGRPPIRPLQELTLLRHRRPMHRPLAGRIVTSAASATLLQDANTWARACVRYRR